MSKFPKTVRLLLSLDYNECKKFKSYLQSPYFNTNEFLLQLCNHIFTEFKINKNPYCEEDFIIKAYGKKETKEETKKDERNYQSHLLLLGKHFECFITTQKIEKNGPLYNQITLEDYLYRGKGVFFMSKYKQAKGKLEKSPIDTYYYQNKFQIEELLDCYKKLYKDKRRGDSNLQATCDAIDRDFILKKLCSLVLMHNRRNITNASYDFGLKSYLLDYFKTKPAIKDPLTNLLYQAYEILTGSDKKKAFENLNEELRQSDQKIAKDMVIVLFTILNNNLKWLIEQKTQLYQELFELYDMMLNQNYIQTDGKLSGNLYKNIVSIGLELEKYDYVESFIDLYKNKLLPVDYAREMYAYNKAKLHIYKGELKNADELIADIDFKDTLYKFDLRAVEIMLSYEMREYRMLESRINKIKVALSCEKNIPEPNKKVYRNFIYCVNNMYRFNCNPNKCKADAQKIITFIENTNQIANRRWVLMRADVLLKKFD